MNLLTTAEAATIAGLSKRRILQLIESGAISAQKIGQQFVIKRSVIEQFAATTRKPGRPRNRPADGQGEAR